MNRPAPQRLAQTMKGGFYAEELQREPVTIRSALANGESPRTAVAVAVMLAVLMVIGIVL